MKNTIQANGKRKTCRIYDNGGESADRYTACFRAVRYKNYGLVYPYLAFNGIPFNPLGFCQHGEHTRKIDGKHLGKRIAFESLNEDCQRLIIQELS